jgi:hypothetical protein
MRVSTVQNNNSWGVVGYFGALTLTLIVFKITEVIEWSWLWVLSPLWIPFAFFAIIIAMALIVMLVKETTKELEKAREKGR